MEQFHGTTIINVRRQTADGFDAADVEARLDGLRRNEDLSRYIL